MTDTELKPCPFCGAHPESWWSCGWLRVTCSFSSCPGRRFGASKAADWNTRGYESELEQLRAENELQADTIKRLSDGSGRKPLSPAAKNLQDSIRDARIAEIEAAAVERANPGPVIRPAGVGFENPEFDKGWDGCRKAYDKWAAKRRGDV